MAGRRKRPSRFSCIYNQYHETENGENLFFKIRRPPCRFGRASSDSTVESGELLRADAEISDLSSKGEHTVTLPVSRTRRAVAIFAGFLFVVVASTATDMAFHTTGVFPPLGQRMSDALFAFALAYRSVFAIMGTYLTSRLAPTWGDAAGDADGRDRPCGFHVGGRGHVGQGARVRTALVSRSARGQLGAVFLGRRQVVPDARARTGKQRRTPRSTCSFQKKRDSDEQHHTLPMV